MVVVVVEVLAVEIVLEVMLVMKVAEDTVVVMVKVLVVMMVLEVMLEMVVAEVMVVVDG